MGYLRMALDYWRHPHKVMQEQVDKNTYRYPMMLVLIAGISDFAGTMQSESFGEDLSLSTLLILLVLVGPVVGYISFMIGSWITDLVAGLFKGERNLRGFRMAFSWAHLIIWLQVLLAFIFISISGADYFTTEFDNAVYFSIDSVIGVVYFVYYLITVKFFYQFSIWKSLLVVLFPLIIVTLILLLIGLLIFL
ncbi:YIP1 family protein [Sediminibacillus massiliensis]|uniref:YIP1 family protein n=1 Tax=Sediminibacillus massiliensis TaxID=1926277 RepID=UPI0009886B10|nr:YIP1 family protein [Sediminibacillus massiliensis]